MLPSWGGISNPTPTAAANTNDQQHNPNLNPNQFKNMMPKAEPVQAAAPAGEAAGAAAGGGEAAAGAAGAAGAAAGGAEIAELAPLLLAL